MILPWINWEIEGARYERERLYSYVPWIDITATIIQSEINARDLLIIVSPLFIPRLRPKTLYLPIDLLRRLRKFL